MKTVSCRCSLTVLALFLLLAVQMAHAFLRCDCKKKQCIKPTNCTVGTHKDMCGCCDICAKSEGELCGGKNYYEGECGRKLQCMVRHIKDNRNRDKQSVSELVGRCEYIPCHYKSCDFGRICTMVDNVPMCSCPKCKDMLMETCCGERNGKTYSNECELRQEECLQTKEIGMIKGGCKARNESRVVCSEDGIRIEVLKSFIGHVQHKKISLLDGQCEFKKNATHFFIETKLNECGTKSSFALTSVIYSNVIRSEIDANAVILRNKDSVQIPVECFYSIRAKGSNKVNIASHGELGKRVVERLRGNGIGVRIREDSNRNQRSVPGGPIKVDIDQESKYFVELRAKALKSTTAAHLFPKFCYVTPVERIYRWMRYTLIEDGCPVENGVEVLNSTTPRIKLLVPGIHFYGTKYPGILVRCKIRACFPKDPNNKEMCQPKCSGDTNSNNNKNNNNNNNKNKQLRRRRRNTPQQDDGQFQFLDFELSTTLKQIK